MLFALLLAAATTVTADIDRLWDWDHPDRSEKAFRIQIETVAGMTPEDRAELLTQLARAQGLQRHFDEANATLDQAEKLLGPTMQRGRVRTELERGRVLNTGGHPEQARPLFLAAYERAKRAHEIGLAIDAAHMLGIVDRREEALRWDQQALDMAEHAVEERDRHWIGSLTNNMGWAYFDDGNYGRALASFQRCEAYHVLHRNQNEVEIARWSMARTMRAMRRYDEALALQLLVARSREEHHLAPDGEVFEEIGEDMLALDRANEARPYFQRAVKLLATDPDIDPRRLKRLQELAAGK